VDLTRAVGLGQVKRIDLHAVDPACCEFLK